MSEATPRRGLGSGGPDDDRGLWGGSPTGRARRFRPPSARAALGAALVAIAAGGVLAARGAADSSPDTSYLVVTSPVAAGEPIASSDLGAVALDLPSDLSAIPADQAARWAGRTARHSLRPMDLLRPDDLADPGAFTSPEAVRVAVEVPRGRVPLEDLHDSNTADLLATSEEVGTTILAAAVPVRLGSEDERGIGTSDRVTLTVEVPDRATAVAVADAAVRSELTVAIPSPAATADRADRG